MRRNQDTFQEVFDLVSPTGSDEQFIREIKQTAVRSRVSPLNALAAAIVAIVVSTAVVISIFADDSAPDVGGSGSGEVTGTSVPVTETTAPTGTESPPTTEPPPPEPFNFRIIDNSEGFEVRLIDVRGDESTMMFELEIKPTARWKFEDSLDRAITVIRPDGIADFSDFEFGVKESHLDEDGKLTLVFEFCGYFEDDEEHEIIGRFFSVEKSLVIFNDDGEGIWSFRMVFAADYELSSLGSALVEE